jgi:hypothetical protein
MKIKIIFFLICLFPVTLFGENDPVLDKIMNHQESKSEIITRGRRVLLDKFIDGDFKKVSEIIHHLKNDVEDENYGSL